MFNDFLVRWNFQSLFTNGQCAGLVRITVCKNKEDVSVSVFYGIKRDFMQAIPCISANKFRRYVINRDEFANCILCLSAQLIRQNPNYSTKPHHDRHVISSAASPVVFFCCCRPCRGWTHGAIAIFPPHNPSLARPAVLTDCLRFPVLSVIAPRQRGAGLVRTEWLHFSNRGINSIPSQRFHKKNRTP